MQLPRAEKYRKMFDKSAKGATAAGKIQMDGESKDRTFYGFLQQKQDVATKMLLLCFLNEIIMAPTVLQIDSQSRTTRSFSYKYFISFKFYFYSWRDTWSQSCLLTASEASLLCLGNK